MNKIRPPSATLFCYPFAIVTVQERMAVFKMDYIFFITIYQILQYKILQTRQHQTQKLRRTALTSCGFFNLLPLWIRRKIFRRALVLIFIARISALRL